MKFVLVFQYFPGNHVGMEEVLTSTWFRYVAFPLGSAALGVAVKYVTRNDQYAKFQKEDMFIGLELILTACLMYVVLTTDRAIELARVNERLNGVLNSASFDQARAAELQDTAVLLSAKIDLAGWTILIMILALWSVSTIVRKWGWVSETEMRPGVGIAFPLGAGILALIFVMMGAAA